MKGPIHQWFVQEILPHEAALMRYIRRAWPDREDASDIRQEIYARIYESATKVRPTQPRRYLFTTARNFIVDRLRRGKIVSIEVRSDLEDMNLLVDELSPERHETARQELRRLSDAFEVLPAILRETIWKRKVEDLSQKAVAAAMGTKERVVERRLSRGIRLLAESFFGTPEDELPTSVIRRKDEREHG
jgi:RNA polymerase sigma factor (sigma-70 family)